MQDRIFELDVFEFISHHKKNRDRRDRLKEIFPGGAESGIFESLINTRLYPYQKQGIIYILEAGRALLADDMGLGKTIQAIAAVEVYARYFGVHKVLVICPTSLKYQWKSEILKFSGRDATVVEGPVHQRKGLYRQEDFYKIISYGAVRNDTKLINHWEADLVILDEAQRIKNWKTQTAKAVKKIPSEYAIVTTGTPLENRIDELHSIVEYIDWFKLGPLFRFLHNHQELDEYGKVAGYKNLRTIHKTLEDIMVRRTRKEIADQLPARTDKNFFVEMTPEQVSDHRDYYDVVARLASRWIQQGYLSEEDRQILLISLNCMRMVSDSTYILDRKTRHGNKAAEVLSLVQEILEDPDNKIVIFSQWKRMFDLLTGELDGRGLKYEYLNGDVPAGNRKTMIERFQGDPSLKIFLSTDAGGVGVNLQSGNVLINVDLPWNPAVLEQRVGRIYRLGQKQNIRVYNFVSKFSIEHRILHLLDFKKSVFRGVLDEGGEDKVMLEGFLQSVRSMLEVSLDGPHKDNYELAAETSMPYHNEIPAGTREDHKQPVSVKPSEVPVQVEDAPSGDKKNGIFKKGILYGFRKKVKRWIKGISDFLYGSN